MNQNPIIESTKETATAAATSGSIINSLRHDKQSIQSSWNDSTIQNDHNLNSWYSPIILNSSNIPYPSNSTFNYTPQSTATLPSPHQSPLDHQMFQYPAIDINSPQYYYNNSIPSDSSANFTKFNPMAMSFMSYSNNSQLSHLMKSEHDISSIPTSPPMTPYISENISQIRSNISHRQSPYQTPQEIFHNENFKIIKNSPKSKTVTPPNPDINIEKEKPFKCPHPGCESRFPRMYNLKSHILCHTGDRPHVCTLKCGAAFARKHDLQRHMRTLHSPTRPFQCQYPNCAHAFRRANSFWRHLVEEHPDTSNEHAEIYQAAVQAHQNQQNQKIPRPPKTTNTSYSNIPQAVPSRQTSQYIPDMMLIQPVSNITPIETVSNITPIEIPSQYVQQHTKNINPQAYPQLPKFDENMVYRGHFSI